MPSILICAIITLYEHQPVSTVCACIIDSGVENFYLKTGPFFVSSTVCENHPFTCVVVSLSDCPGQLSSYTTDLDC